MARITSNNVSSANPVAVVIIGEPSLDDLREGWEDLVNKIADINLRQQFIGKLVEERYFRRKFVKFIEQHIENDQDFWAYERRPKGSGRIDKKNLKNILNNIYDQRSSTLHTGEPFPFYVFDRTTLPSLENYPEEGWLEKSITIHRQEMDEIPFTTLIYGGRT